jgi:hypothetical protein
MILVVGSTGILGGLVVRKLAITGRSVTAFVRDLSSEKAMALKAAGAQTVVRHCPTHAELLGERGFQFGVARWLTANAYFGSVGLRCCASPDTDGGSVGGTPIPSWAAFISSSAE